MFVPLFIILALCAVAFRVRLKGWHPDLAINRMPVAALLFFSALILRLFYFGIHPDLTFGASSIFGTPFSVAHSWHQAAVDISQGRGIAGWLPDQRPVYPLFLACVHIWFGPGITLAKIANILCQSLTVVFVYHIGRKAFGRDLALFSALFLALSPEQLVLPLLFLPIHTGVLFFTIAVWLVMEAGQNKIRWFSSGLFFALLCLSSPLAIPAAFCGAIYLLYYSALNKSGPKHTLIFLAVFIFGFLIAMAPWLCRQKIVYGAYSMDFKVEIANVSHPGETGDVFKQTGQEKKSIPVFFLEFINSRTAKAKPHSLAIAGLLLWLFIISVSRRPVWLFNVLLTVYGCVLLIAEYTIPVSLIAIPVLFGMAAAIISIRNRYVLLLSFCLIFMSLAQNESLPGPIACDWLFSLFYLYGFYFLFIKGRDLLFRNIPVRMKSQEIAPLLDWNTSGLFSGAMLAAVLFFGLSLARLGYINWIASPLPDLLIPMTVNQKIQVARAVKNTAPAIFSGDRIDSENAFARSLSFNMDKWNHGRIFVIRTKVLPGAYFIPADKQVEGMCGLFESRPYDRTVLLLPEQDFFVFPGRIEKNIIQKECFFIGRQSIDTTCNYEGRRVVEGLAIVPVDKATDDLNFFNILLAQEAAHGEIVEKLVSMRRGWLEIDKAIVRLHNSLLDKGGGPASYYKLGQLYAKKQDWNNAAINYEQALTLKPDSFSAANALGAAYVKINSPGKAKKALLTALSIKPESMEAVYNLACANAKAWDLENAIECLGLAVARGFDDWQAMLNDPDLKNMDNIAGFKRLMRADKRVRCKRASP